MKLRLASCRGTPLPSCEAFTQLSPACSRDEALEGRHAVDRIALPAALFEAARERLWTYRIFAAGRMEAKVCTPEGRVTEGATIFQRIFVGPTALSTSHCRAIPSWASPVFLSSLGTSKSNPGHARAPG